MHTGLAKHSLALVVPCQMMALVSPAQGPICLILCVMEMLGTELGPCACQASTLLLLTLLVQDFYSLLSVYFSHKL